MIEKPTPHPSADANASRCETVERRLDREELEVSRQAVLDRSEVVSGPTQKAMEPLTKPSVKRSFPPV